MLPRIFRIFTEGLFLLINEQNTESGLAMRFVVLLIGPLVYVFEIAANSSYDVLFLGEKKADECSQSLSVTCIVVIGRRWLERSTATNRDNDTSIGRL